MSEFTPGPWEYGHDEQSNGALSFVFHAVKAGGKRLLRMNHENAEADAHLIAAAPEMYEALDHIQYLHASGAFKLKDKDYSAICKVADALAKAEGKETDQR